MMYGGDGGRRRGSAAQWTGSDGGQLPRDGPGMLDGGRGDGGDRYRGAWGAQPGDRVVIRSTLGLLRGPGRGSLGPEIRNISMG